MNEIDWDGDLELDDGTPVIRIDRGYAGKEAKSVSVPKGMYRPSYRGRKEHAWDEPGIWQFYATGSRAGIFIGCDHERMFVIQNVARPEQYVPEDWS